MTYDQHNPEVVLDPEMEVALLEAQTALQPPPALRLRVLERVRQAAAHGFITIRSGNEEWKMLAPGLEVKRLFLDERAQTVSFLVRAQPGACMPAHHHSMDEECLVLEGEFTMGELHLRAGDYHCAPAGSTHELAAATTPVLAYLRGA
ncbi:MAG: hypothetical protein FD130_2492, partial [Halothiobacillaceae bacterium]